AGSLDRRPDRTLGLLPLFRLRKRNRKFRGDGGAEALAAPGEGARKFHGAGLASNGDGGSFVTDVQDPERAFRSGSKRLRPSASQVPIRKRRVGDPPRVQFQRLEPVQKLPQLLFAHHPDQQLTLLLRLRGQLVVEHHLGKIKRKLTLDLE